MQLKVRNRVVMDTIKKTTYNREKYLKNKEKRMESSMKWAKKNPQKISEIRKRHRLKNKDSIREYHTNYCRERAKVDIAFKLQCTLRKRLCKFVKNKKNSILKYLGCDLEYLKQHLESKFQPGMTWDNHGTNGWHIDHIKPLISFDLTKEDDLIIACHYSNLQPLWAIDNLIKKDKY
jgi:hypothetical protein